VPPLRPLAEVPTLRKPFIFFHIPKCGGTSLKAVLHSSAEAAGVDSLVSCHDTTCKMSEKRVRLKARDVDLLRKFSCATVFGGHFTTDLLTRLEKLEGAPEMCTRGWKLGGTDYDCLVPIREPIAQFVSNYYQEIYTGKKFEKTRYKNRPLKDLSPEDLESLIRGNNLLNNKIALYLSGNDRHPNRERSRPSYDWTDEMREAEGQLSQCVVTVLEEWESSAKLVGAAVPWMRGMGEELEGTTLHVAPNRGKHEGIGDLRPESAAALRQLLLADIRLYERGLEVFQAQLRQYGIEDAHSSEEG